MKTIDLNVILGLLMAAAFLVNIIVQLTKEFIPLPTKLWCIFVAFTVDLVALFIAFGFELVILNTSTILLSLIGSFIVAFIAMYGFDTFKELWVRFKAGEDINDDSK